MYTTKQIHAAIREAALDFWSEVIVDRDGSPEIERMFRSIRWDFHIVNGYRDKAKWAWCGVFAANCMLKIGEHLEENQCVPVLVDLDILHIVMPSTKRLASKKKWEAATDIEPQIFRDYDRLGVRRGLIPGAICTIATRKYGNYRDDVGGHVVIVDEYDGGDTFTTIEGNANGRFGNGSHGEGVIRRVRNVADVRRVYLLQPEHLEYMGM